MVKFRTTKAPHGWIVKKLSEDNKLLDKKHFEHKSDAEYWAKIGGRQEHIKDYLKDLKKR